MNIGEVLACNCSRCGRLGSLLAFAPATQFNLLADDADLTKFEFNKHTIQHQFCSTCGIQSFAIGTHPKTDWREDGDALSQSVKRLVGLEPGCSVAKTVVFFRALRYLLSS
jgi:hypothetical protein